MFVQTYVADVLPVVEHRTSARVPLKYSGSAAVRSASSVPPSRTSYQYHHVPSPSPSDLLLIMSSSPSPLPLSAYGYTAAPPSDLQACDFGTLRNNNSTNTLINRLVPTVAATGFSDYYIVYSYSVLYR